MTSVNRRRHEQYASRIAHLEAFLLIASTTSEEWGLHFYPPSVLAELREEAQHELAQIRAYCDEDLVSKAPMPPASPDAQREADLDELAMLLYGAARKQIKREREQERNV